MDRKDSRTPSQAYMPILLVLLCLALDPNIVVAQGGGTRISDQSCKVSLTQSFNQRQFAFKEALLLFQYTSGCRSPVRHYFMPNLWTRTNVPVYINPHDKLMNTTLAQNINQWAGVGRICLDLEKVKNRAFLGPAR